MEMKRKKGQICETLLLRSMVTFKYFSLVIHTMAAKMSRERR